MHLPRERLALPSSTSDASDPLSRGRRPGGYGALEETVDRLARGGFVGSYRGYRRRSGTKPGASTGPTSSPHARRRRAMYSVGVIPVKALKSRMALSWSE